MKKQDCAFTLHIKEINIERKAHSSNVQWIKLDSTFLTTKNLHSSEYNLVRLASSLSKKQKVHFCDIQWKKWETLFVPLYKTTIWITFQVAIICIWLTDEVILNIVSLFKWTETSTSREVLYSYLTRSWHLFQKSGKSSIRGQLKWIFTYKNIRPRREKESRMHECNLISMM